MSENFIGVIIEESLEDKKILEKLKIIKTRIEEITERHKTPWIEKWTLYTVEIPKEKVDEVAKIVSKSLDSEHSWYADFKNEKIHFIIFKNKVFKIDRKSKEQYNEARNYGISLGIPEYQVAFKPTL